MFFKCSFWNPGCGRKGPTNYGLSVLPSFCPSVLPSRIFIGIWNSTWCWRSIWCCPWQTLFFREKIAPKMGQTGQKCFFFNLLENLVINFFGIWYIREFYCCILAQILYLWKMFFLRYGPKCSWPIRLQNF